MNMLCCQENVKSFNIEDVATFDTVSKMKSEIANLRSDLVNQEKLAGEHYNLKLQQIKIKTCHFQATLLMTSS